MAKLYFRYGTVGSAKTLNLLAISHAYEVQGKKAYLLKPKMDTRFGESNIRSRVGLESTADMLVHDDMSIMDELPAGIDCVLVDEVQFLSKEKIEELRAIASIKSIPVICYGLRADFRTHLFEGSKRLFELADSIDEVKTTCFFCTKKAVYNLRLQDGIPTLSGSSIELGLDDKYVPCCSRCYENKTASCHSEEYFKSGPKEISDLQFEVSSSPQ